MRGIIIAAGMGKRMQQYTKSKPKCLLSIGKKTILQWTVEGLKAAGCNDIFVITGHKGNEISKLGYKTIENKDYQTNNILHSLFKAKNLFDQELIVVYSDIYVEKEIFKGLALNKKDLVLTVDKSWQEYYVDRSLHPEEQAEKIIIDNNSKVLEIGKDLIINKSKKYYEFIGLFKASEKAAAKMKNTFLMIDNKINSKDKFERSGSWSNAYLTDFFQFIINNNILEINVNIVSKGWAEFDTIEDYNRLNNIIKSQKLISIK
tara:strand:+ start:1073 stop:1855 length:783 start_codon:yes stop_codon:yes gene_type:complete